MSYIPNSRPRGSVHDLQHALDLKDQGANWLCVSDATLYFLQNITDLDVVFKSRWAVEFVENYYVPITPDHELYGAWVDLIDQIRAEVSDMSCDITPILQEISDNIALQTAKLDEILDAMTTQTTLFDTFDELIDDVEPIMDSINVALGAAAILGA